MVARNRQRLIKIVIWIVVAMMTLTFVAALLPTFS